MLRVLSSEESSNTNYTHVQSNYTAKTCLYSTCHTIDRLTDLYNKSIATKKQALIFLEGDQVTYARIQSLKAEYGGDLAWLIPFGKITKRYWSKSTLMQA